MSLHKDHCAELPVIGIHTFRAYVLPQELEDRIEALIAARDRGEIEKTEANRQYSALFAEMQRYKTRELVVKNLVVTVGRSVLAQRLANTTTYTGIINYGALGSSATAPTNADTRCTTEVFRKVVASASFTTNVAFIDFFYAKADTNGTYQEFGTFIDGTATVNSGQMFTHALTGGWTKLATESMTVSCQYTFT